MPIENEGIFDGWHIAGSSGLIDMEFRRWDLTEHLHITSSRSGPARVFSHKPTLVSVIDDGSIAHNGRRTGMLYRVAETVREDDLVPVPHSTIGEGQESAHRAPAAHRRHCASADRPG